jgi:hypothetical protein
MIIKNYGLRWQRDLIFWGWKGKAGCLLGRLADNTVDFRGQIGIYILYDNEKIVYIGQAVKDNYTIFSRLKDHTRDSLADRWNRFSWFGIRKVVGGENLASIAAAYKTDTKDMLDHLEAILLAVVEPQLNKQGGKWIGASQYIQEKHEEHPEDIETLIRELHQKLCAGE